MTDHLGTPTEMYDDLGKLTWRMHLDIFGAGRHGMARQSCPWRWPGQYEDVETHLCYNRFRWYASLLGRYLSLDPIGIAGGTDLYAYVPDPIFYIDPLGLACYVADRVDGGLAISREITEKQALARLRSGLDVYTDSKSEAKSLAKRALRGKPMHHGPHQSGHCPHYHPDQHANASHVFCGRPTPPPRSEPVMSLFLVYFETGNSVPYSSPLPRPLVQMPMVVVFNDRAGSARPAMAITDGIASDHFQRYGNKVVARRGAELRQRLFEFIKQRLAQGAKPHLVFLVIQGVVKEARLDFDCKEQVVLDDLEGVFAHIEPGRIIEVVSKQSGA